MTIQSLTPYSKSSLFAFFLIGSGIITLIVFGIAYITASIDTTVEALLIDELAKIGDFVGGLVGAIWALAGVILLFETLRVQNIQINNNQRNIELQQAHSTALLVHNIINGQSEHIQKLKSDLVVKSSDEVHEGDEALSYVFQFLPTASFYKHFQRGDHGMLSNLKNNEIQVGKFIFGTLFWRFIAQVNSSSSWLYDEVASRKFLSDHDAKSIVTLFISDHNLIEIILLLDKIDSTYSNYDTSIEHMEELTYKFLIKKRCKRFREISANLKRLRKLVQIADLAE